MRQMRGSAFQFQLTRECSPAIIIIMDRGSACFLAVEAAAYNKTRRSRFGVTYLWPWLMSSRICAYISLDYRAIWPGKFTPRVFRRRIATCSPGASRLLPIALISDCGTRSPSSRNAISSWRRIPGLPSSGSLLARRGSPFPVVHGQSICLTGSRSIQSFPIATRILRSGGWIVNVTSELPTATKRSVWKMTECVPEYRT